MKKKSPESNIQSLTSEKDELLLLINDLNESIQAKWIEKNIRKHKKINCRLLDLNNTVDNEIRILSVHNKKRKQLENLQLELLGMNWLLNQYPTAYNQTLQFNNQSQQVYNQPWTDNINVRENNRLNESQTKLIEVTNNNQKWRTKWNWNTWRTLWFVAAWVWLWALIYKWFKKLFWKDEEAEEKADKESEDKDNKQDRNDNSSDSSDESEDYLDDETVEKYDESLIKRYNDMVESLKKRRNITYQDKNIYSSLDLMHYEGYNRNSWIILNKIYTHRLRLGDDESKILTYRPNDHIDLKNWNKPWFYFSNNWTRVKKEVKHKKISNKKLKEILDEYDNYIRKYG